MMELVHYLTDVTEMKDLVASTATLATEKMSTTVSGITKTTPKAREDMQNMFFDIILAHPTIILPVSRKSDQIAYLDLGQINLKNCLKDVCRTFSFVETFFNSKSF